MTAAGCAFRRSIAAFSASSGLNRILSAVESCIAGVGPRISRMLVFPCF
jgi:hypothetical protein